MSLHCGWKPKYPKETHADTRRTCKLHTERPRPDLNPSYSAIQCTTMPTITHSYQS
uniref:Uncharacterized protein n=1 Tax=Anguilla anguilla TaxID=7936 RepID=A0A0E9SCY9_ANGAN